MEKLRVIILSLCSFLFLSCITQKNKKFYKEVVKNDENTTKEHFPDSSVYHDKKELGDPDKKIFDLVRNELKNVNHIYYAYLPQITGVIPNVFIEGFIYDKDKDIFYFIRQLDVESENFELIDKPSEYTYYRARFIVKHLNNNDCKSIQDAGDGYNQIGQVVYDINLKEKKINRCSFNYLSLYTDYIKSIKKK